MVAPMLDVESDRVTLVQEEPALDLAMPRVSRQPPRPRFTRGRVPVAPLVRTALTARRDDTRATWGEAYGMLLVEYHPALQWAFSCWDYLLSTEGCRFVPRDLGERRYHRSDYRAATDQEFARLVPRGFKACLLAYQPTPRGPAFTPYLHRAFWPAVRDQYRQLDRPDDARQRTLTALSYLRCTPYRFLNEYHDELVRTALQALPHAERQVLAQYHLHFYTEEATSAMLDLEILPLRELLAHALHRLRQREPLAYHLLRQIERY